jgi:hypothetical protein
MNMTTDQGHEASGKPRRKKAAQRRAASKSPASKAGKENDVSVTTTSPASAGTSTTGSGGDQKDWTDFLAQLAPGLAQTVAPELGIDPRIAGQTVSQVLSIFGIGGPGKAFTPAIPKDQALSQLQQVVTPHLSDPGFSPALVKWLQAALEPVQAQKQGKAFQPSVDMSKDWFSDAINSIGHAVSSVNWGQVAQVGMQILPQVLAAFA